MTATKQRFLKWTDELEKLKDIQIPRDLLGEINESDDVSIRAFLISQIHFFFVLQLEVVSKKLIKNIPYGERVQLDRLVPAPETSFFPFKLHGEK